MSDSVKRDVAEAAGIAFRFWTTARVSDRMMVGPALDYARDVLDGLDGKPAAVVVNCDMLLGVMAACESRGQKVAVLSRNPKLIAAIRHHHFAHKAFRPSGQHLSKPSGAIVFPHAAGFRLPRFPWKSKRARTVADPRP